MKNISRKHANNWPNILVLLGLAVLFPLGASAQNLAATVEALDDCVKKMDMQIIIDPVTESVKVERRFVEQVLVTKRYKVSDLVYIKVIAAKSGKAQEEILNTYAKRNWASALKQEGVDKEEIQTQMDEAYMELATRILDIDTKKNDRRTAKK
ncbi:MAG: hypothetical protein WCO56_05895 [Verrucomicrobiota bacterium]